MYVKARLVAKGYQDSGVKDDLVETSGRTILRSSHLQVISLGALEKWDTWNVGKQNAFLQADGSCSEVLLRDTVEWCPTSANRTWKLQWC